jgi:glycosyltransferase involved in cell wall biosynthesis
MKRWVLAAGDFTPLGGMDWANHALAQHLAGAGREVHLVAHRVWASLAAAPGVVVHEVPRPLGSHLLGAPLLSRAASRVAERLGRGTRLLSNGGNTRWESPTWIHYLHAAHAPRVATGLRARGVAAAGRRLFLARERDALRRAPAVICNSERTAADVRRHYDIPGDRLCVVYYGTDPRRFGPISSAERAEARKALGLESSRRTAVFIGALSDRRKGFDLLFDAWRALCAGNDWNVDLAVVGSGAEVETWERRGHQAGLAGRFRFLRFRSDIPRVLAACDLLVHPARYEAYGLGVHEALSRALPVIVSGSAGVAERIDDDLRSLMLPDPLRVDDLVARMRLWHDDPPRWQRAAERAGAVLRSRTWDHMADEIVRIVEDA